MERRDPQKRAGAQGYWRTLTVPMNEAHAHGERRVVFVTGGARRIGAAIARRLHAQDCDVVVHARRDKPELRALLDELNSRRADSAHGVHGDLLDVDALAPLVAQAAAWRGRLDVLVNNASSFYPTPLGSVTAAQFDDLIGTNLRAPIFVSQAALPWLRAARGCIVNLLDVHAERPLGDHVVYESAKAGLRMMTLALARELAPQVRVNAVAPGNILWNEEHPHDETLKQALLARIPQQRLGSAQDIADAVAWLASAQAGYVTGQVIHVDGGYSLS